MKLTVLCLFGGKSEEYEISLMSAGTVIPALDTKKYDVITVGITKDGKWYRYAGPLSFITDNTWHTHPEYLRHAMLSPSGDRILYTETDTRGVFEETVIDAAFPVMHGAFSEDGTLQGLLEVCNIPFVGPGCAASAVSMDKTFAKRILADFDIPMARFLSFSRREIDEAPETVIAQAEAFDAYPLFVKPANAGSSVGASKAHDREELVRALHTAAKIDSKIMVEECIEGREVECAVLGNDDPKATVPGEIFSGAAFYDYDAKYVTDTSEAFIPARIREETREKIREYAVKIFSVLGCRGLSRVDFFVRMKSDGTEEILFNEINTLPGFTKISMYPKLWNYMGTPTPELVDRLIALAREV